MRFRLGVVTGFAGGYYLGAKAGRERYEQINKAIRRTRGSETFEAVADKTKAVVEEVEDRVEAARDTAQQLIDSRLGNGQSKGSEPA